MVKEHNIGVAAAFHVHGYQSVGVECQGGRVAFLFSGANRDALAVLRQQFYGGTLTVIAVDYNSALRVYSSRLRNALRGEILSGGAR
jgi:hypothetical protein